MGGDGASFWLVSTDCDLAESDVCNCLSSSSGQEASCADVVSRSSRDLTLLFSEASKAFLEKSPAGSRLDNCIRSAT